MEKNINSRGKNNTFTGELSGNDSFNLSTCFDNTFNGYLTGTSIKDNQYQNCYFGSMSGSALFSGYNNSGFGFKSLYSSTNIQNSAFGSFSLSNLKSGFFNTALGYLSGLNYQDNESSNICLGSKGHTGISHEICIGEQGTGVGQQNKTYIAGIYGTTVSDSVPVCISPDGQLGVSSHYKDLLKEINDLKSRVNSLESAGHVNHGIF